MTKLSRALFARCRGPLPWSHSATWLVTAAVVAMLNASGALAVTIDWVTVGDPGNAADTTGYGAVGYSYRISTYEFTNAQYAEFLNAVDPDGTNPNNVYDPVMATDVRGGISKSGTVNSGRYTVRENMGNKPVNFVSFFEAARVANWLHNGSPVSSGTTNASATAPQNTGAYTLGTATGNTGPYPLRNVGARYWIPIENEWYKAAYYKGSGTNSGYWQYATQVTGTAPIGVGATVVGTGTMSGVSPVAAGNYANFNRSADWGSPTVLDGNLTTVGSNGAPSVYGAFDMGGNVEEWFSFATLTTHVGLRGGSYHSTSSTTLSATVRDTTTVSGRIDFRGFRLASSPVPEIDPAGMGSVLALVTGALGLLERRRKRAA